MSINFNNNVISIKLKTENFNISKKNHELDKRTQLITENLNNLMTILNRILINDKINEISYEKIYTLAYKICNEKANKELYDNLSQILQQHLTKIYREIERYFLEFKEMSEFVNKMLETYRDFSYRVNIIQKTLLYYEKNFLQKQNIYEENLKLLADTIFFNVFINETTKYRIIEFVVDFLKKARENEYFDKLLLRSLIGFFLEIKPKENAYREILEQKIIISSIQYFQKNCYEKYFLDNINSEDVKNSLNYISRYIKEIYRILIDEELRYIEFNLIISRCDLLENILETLLLKVIAEEDLFFKFLISTINDPQKDIISVLRNCLDFPLTLSHTINKKEEHKFNFYHLNIKKKEIVDNKQNTMNKETSRIKNIKKILYSKIVLALETVGKNLLGIEKIGFLEKRSTNSTNTNIHIESIISIVENLLKLIENIELLKQQANIVNDEQYSTLIQGKLSMIVNNKFSNFNKEEKEILFNNFLFNLSKNLAIHIDYTFKNFPHKFNYDYVVNYIERIMLIFRLLEDKDIFEINNRKFLCQRILSQIYNEEIEMKLINRLKLENGTIFTFRSEIMINDIKNSINIFDNYRTSKYYHKLVKNLDEFKDVDINFKILTQGSWIINQEENICSKDLINLSENNKRFGFLRLSEHFEEYYKAFFPGKLLNHNISNSTCELYTKINGRNYCFTVCPLQALILLCFNYQKSNSKNNQIKKDNFDLKHYSKPISMIRIYSYFHKINKSVFLNSLTPLVKLGIVKIILIKLDKSKEFINDIKDPDKLLKTDINDINKHNFVVLNTKESKLPIFDLLSHYFELESNKKLLEKSFEVNLKRNKSNKLLGILDRSNYKISEEETIILNSLDEFIRMNVDEIALNINLNFHSKQQKLRINFLREKEKKNIQNNLVENKEIEEESETLKIERKYQIESNIIRILKCKKTITHQELINETLTALANYFVPNIAMIKLRLENLIERGFISRDKNDYNKYIYEM